MIKFITAKQQPQSIANHALILFFAALLLLVAPYFSSLPVWIPLMTVACCLYRWQMHNIQWPMPPQWLRIMLVLGSLVGLYVSFDNFLSLEPMVGLFIIGQSFKLIEARYKRDTYLVLLLSYFLLASHFLFDQSIVFTIYLLIVLLILLMAQTAMHQSDRSVSVRYSFNKAGLIMLQALPLMLVLFITFPRFAPLWQVPVPGNQAKTGMSDSLSPGDIASLAESDQLAFRIEFSGAKPNPSQLYWRGIVMSDFDGRKWQARPLTFFEPVRLPYQHSGLTINYSYTIFIEPTHQHWVFSLAWPYAVNSNIFMGNGQTVRSAQPLNHRKKIQLSSAKQPVKNNKLLAKERYLYTNLPNNSNPETEKLALQLLNQSSSKTAYIDNVLNYYRNNNFIYTLQPPTLGQHSVDEFLLQTRKGFCEHYASSFAVFMRAANIPARVVAGYQGGEFNPNNGSLLVRQYDAHAWVEVWLDNIGWQLIDPTAAVSPIRVERGSTAAQLGGELAGTNRLNRSKFIKSLLFRMDAMQFYWAKWVLNFDSELQLKALTGLLGNVDPLRVGSMIFAITLVVALWSLSQSLHFFSGQQLTHEAKLLRKIQSRLNNLGIDVQHQQSFKRWQQVIQHSNLSSEQKVRWQQLIDDYRNMIYQPLTPAEKTQRIKAIQQKLQHAFKRG